MEKRRLIMDDKAMQRAIARIAYEILEHNKGAKDLCIVGVLSRGVALGKRIADKISELENVKVNYGILDITLWRDDLNDNLTNEENASISDKTDINFDVKNMKIVIVDDVIYTGRSSRAAMDLIMSRGRPQSIQLAVLIDRGHRELPIRPDYIGKNLPTSRNESVKVSVKEVDGEDNVALY